MIPFIAFSCILHICERQKISFKNAALYTNKANEGFFFNIHFTRAYKELYQMSVISVLTVLQQTVKNISITFFCIKNLHKIQNQSRHIPTTLAHIFIFLVILHKYLVFPQKHLKFCACCSIIYSACIAFYIILFILTIL